MPYTRVLTAALFLLSALFSTRAESAPCDDRPGRLIPIAYCGGLTIPTAPALATAYTLTGPATGTVGTPTTAFTVKSNGLLNNAITVTPQDSNHGGTFTPPTVTLAAGIGTSATFTYTPAQAATYNIFTTSSGSAPSLMGMWLTNSASSPTIAQVKASAPEYNHISYLLLSGADSSGTLSLDLTTYGGNGTNLTNDITAWKASGRTISVMVDDAQPGGGSANFLTPTNATNAVTSITSAINTYGFNGIEWDLEGGENTTWNKTTIDSINSQLLTTFPALIIGQAPRPFELHANSTKRGYMSTMRYSNIQYYFGPDQVAIGGAALACTQIQALEGGTDGSSEGMSQFINGSDGGLVIPVSKINFGQYVTGGSQNGCTPAQYAGAFKSLSSTYPGLNGAQAWQSVVDKSNSYSFGPAFGLTDPTPISFTAVPASGGTSFFVCSGTCPNTGSSSTGNDANPGTLAQPFLTLAKCQSAMQGSPTNKTCTLRKGTFSFSNAANCSAAVVLTPADNGEIWQNYSPDGVDTAIMDGANATFFGFWIQGGSNITINGLKIQNFRLNGIRNTGGWADTRDSCPAGLPQPQPAAQNNIFENNEITGMTIGQYSGFGNSGAIIDDEATPGTKILHNYIHDVVSIGIFGGQASDFNPPGSAHGGDFSNVLVQNNVILNANKSDDDTGSIYFWNPFVTKSGPATVDNNYIRDYSGFTGTTGHCIYLDFEASNITSTNNICTGASNAYAVLVSAGMNDHFTNNIIDVNNTALQIIWLHITSVLSTPGANDLWSNNLILSKNAGGYPTVTGTGLNDNNPYAFVDNTGGMASPTIQNDFYCNYNVVGAGLFYDTGDRNDASPVHCGGTDPGISGVAYTIASGSPVLNSPVSFKPIPATWGPPGFVLPAAPNVPPSSPH